MKAVLTSALVALAVLAPGAAQASPEMAANLCGKCHDMEKKKKGPTYKAMATKFKGKEADALKAIEDPKNDHPEIKGKPDDVRTVVKWMLQQ